MDTDQPQNFNERLSQWIASQGFWFQLRHSMSGGGGLSVAMFHLLRMGLRLLVVAALVLAGVAVYLVMRVKSPEFRTELRDATQRALHAEKVELAGFRRSGAGASVTRFGATGGEDSFFESIEAGVMSFDMGFLDGTLGRWDAGVIKGNWLDVELRPGMETAAQAEAAAESFLEPAPGFRIAGLAFSDARVSWGFSERTYGGIANSRLNATRTADGWRLVFSGGSLSQNWLRDLAIEELVLRCTEEGVEVERGRLGAGGGGVEVIELRVIAGARPQVEGRLRLEHVDLDALLPEAMHDKIDGRVSGELVVEGGTFSSEGLGFDGRIALEDRDSVVLRDRIHLLEALDVADVFNSYKRVEFGSGGFDLRTGSGELVMSGIDLRAGELMTMQGRIEVRPPDDEDMKRLLGDEAGELVPGLGDEGGLAPDRPLELSTLAQRLRAETGEGVEGSGFFADMAELRRLRREQAERARKMMIFSGGVRITLPGDAFQRSRSLRERFPVDQASGRVAIDVPLRGQVEGLTLGLAEEILELGSERD